MFDTLRAQKLADASAVADVIYRAATDGTDTLRYAIGNEDFMKRMENRVKLDDQAYVQSVRDQFTKYL